MYPLFVQFEDYERSLVPAERRDTDHEFRFMGLDHMKLSSLYPVLDRPFIHATDERRLLQCHHASLS